MIIREPHSSSVYHDTVVGEFRPTSVEESEGGKAKGFSETLADCFDAVTPSTVTENAQDAHAGFLGPRQSAELIGKILNAVNDAIANVSPPSTTPDSSVF